MTRKQKIFFGILSLALVSIAVLRSTEQLLSYTHPFTSTYVFALHVSPQFRPFARHGDYERLTQTTNVYIMRTGKGYERVNPYQTAEAIGGPHAAAVAIYSAVIEIHGRMQRGQDEAAYAVVKRLYCDDADAEHVRIDILQNDSGQLLHRYEIPC